MANEEPGRAPQLTAETLRALEQASFLRLAQLLDRHYPEASPIGSTRSAKAERVRFKANPTLGFPAAEIASVRHSDEIEDGLEVRLNLIGLYGPSSPLPTSYSERVVHSEGANALGDFFDLFNHRLAGLLYQLWRQYQHHVRYERGAVDPISLAVGALFGLPTDVEEGPAKRYRLQLMPYSGLLALNSRSASSLASVLSHVFSMPCEIEECVPRWIRVPAESCFALGARNTELGAETLLGDTLADVAGCFRVWCGPIPFSRYKEFLPNRETWPELSRLTDFVIPQPLERQYGFRIEIGTTPDWALGEGELGWTTWAEPDREKPIEIVF